MKKIRKSDLKHKFAQVYIKRYFTYRASISVFRMVN